jgi:glucan 1,3-beta-glucosidase
MTALKGINLGGWLVAERWMTPKLFSGLSAHDEWSLRASDPGEGRERLKRHRETFVTEADIATIAREGFDMVRLPVGYWLWRQADGYLEDSQIVGRLLDWCQTYSLGVIISLHGAPGSQNGWDHSGRIGDIGWQRSENVELSRETVADIVKRYGHHPALIGINPLNEPHDSLPLGTLGSYYLACAKLIREGAHAGVRTIFSDSFRPRAMQQELQRLGLMESILDVHLYQVFDSKYRSLTFDEHIGIIQNDWQQLLSDCSAVQDVMVGEWSAMLDAELFAGLGDETRHGMIRHYYDEQKELFDTASWGWSYWSYKTGGGSVWNWSEHADLTLSNGLN